MAKKTNNITFKIKSVNNLINFLKRFSVIDKQLLLEVTQQNLLAKSNTTDRATVKYSKIAIGDVLEAKSEFDADLLKIGIIDINKFCNAFKHFVEGDEIFLDVLTDKIGDDLLGVEMKLYTKELKITLPCQDVSLYTYISAEALKRIVKSVQDEKVMEFPFPKEVFSKVSSLCGMDSGEDHVKVRVSSDGKVYVKGKSFEYHLLDVKGGTDIELTFKNNQFGYIDQEISAFHLSPNRMLVKSTDSDTLIVLGKQE